jgi:hypothetical protein
MVKRSDAVGHRWQFSLAGVGVLLVVSLFGVVGQPAVLAQDLKDDEALEIAVEAYI